MSEYQNNLFGPPQPVMTDEQRARNEEREEQERHLNRVTGNIAEHIRAFARRQGSVQWHMVDLHSFVGTRAQVAPASCDRILRALRASGELSYRVINRRNSLYEFI